MNAKIFSAILHEYGMSWLINRSLYSIKLKMMKLLPMTEYLFERKIPYPERLDIFQINVSALKQFIQRLSQNDKETLIKYADDVSQGRILGFSSFELDYGYPINWQLNPLTQIGCDIKKKWYQIPDFVSDRGDIKVIWEISRFSHFITLARAYLLTDDERYYKVFSQQLEDWLQKNPYSYGANFKCGQECSLRMINALLAYTIFKCCGLTMELDEINLKDLICRCYRKILSNFFYAQKCIKNNHTLSELTGMIIGAWCCKDEDSLNDAFKLLDKTIQEQFTPDGGYTQHSFNYQRLALQDVEIVMAVGRTSGHILSDVSRKKIRNAVNLMYQCQDESGDMPNYGANDGALAFPVTSCGYRDFRPVINTLYALLTGYRLYVNGSYDEELIWFGGPEVDRFLLKQTARVSSSFRQAGLYTLRNRNSWMMIVLNDYKSRPAHMDQMHIDLWIRQCNVLCDSGTFSYTGEMATKMVLNDAHNTVVYDGKSQMNSYGHFMIYNWTVCSEVNRGAGAFYGKVKSRNGYTHRRSVKQINTGYLVEDFIEADNDKQYEILFHTPCEVQVVGARCVKLLYAGEHICSLEFSTDFRIYKSLRSLYYLRSEGIYCVAATGIVKNGYGYMKTIIRVEKGI